MNPGALADCLLAQFGRAGLHASTLRAVSSALTRMGLIAQVDQAVGFREGVTP